MVYTTDVANVAQQSYQESVLIVTWIYNAAGQHARSKAQCSLLRAVYKVLIRLRERGHGWEAEINTRKKRQYGAVTPPLHIVYVERSAADLMFADLWAAVHIMALMYKNTGFLCSLMSLYQQENEALILSLCAWWVLGRYVPYLQPCLAQTEWNNINTATVEDITGMIYKAGEDAKYKSSLTHQDPSNRPGWCLTVCILPEVYWGLSQRTWLWSSGYGGTLLEKETMNSQRAPVITRFVFNAFFLELERSSENVC